MGSRLDRDFWSRDVLQVAPELIGTMLGRRFDDGRVELRPITEVEAYRGEEDLASHARFGKTERNGVMYGEAGQAYVYLIYGVYWLLNIVTGKVNEPQAVLIRGVQGIIGPGKVGRWLRLDGSFYRENIVTSDRIWIERNTVRVKVEQAARIGVDYAGEWAKKPWRWVLTGKP